MKKLVVSLVLFYGIISVTAQNRPVFRDNPSEASIFYNVSKSGQNVLTAGIRAAGLAELLGGSGQFTFIAPSDNAILYTLPVGRAEQLFNELLPEQQPELYEIIAYHILPGMVTVETLTGLIRAGGGKATLTTLNKRTLIATLTKDNTIELTDDYGRKATLVQTDYKMANGVVHTASQILLPQGSLKPRIPFHAPATLVNSPQWLKEAEALSPQTPVTLYPSGIKIEKKVPFNHDYHQTLICSVWLASAPYEGNSRRRDLGTSVVRNTVEQVLEQIIWTDRATSGIPKIFYLWGWYYNGHDSKYPAWFEVCEGVKRPQDANALESIKWLMEEGKKYNTTVTVAINLNDAYEDSPLWDDYLKYNIIGRLENGSIRKAVGWGYPVDFVQELKTGFLQKRVDKLFEMFPIKEKGVVHIDAFHTWSPLDPRGPISPWLGYTVEEEEEAQREIWRYFSSKGVNVTSEFVHDFRDSAFEGYQPYAWTSRFSAQEYLDWPASLYCGGSDRTELGRIFCGTSNAGGSKPNFNRGFCLNTLPWYYVNRLERKSYTATDTWQSVTFSDHVVSKLEKNGRYTLMQDNRLMIENENVFVPALWIEGKAIIAYSTDGYNKRTWELPADWSGVKKAALFDVTPDAVTPKGTVNIQNNRLTISVQKGQQILIKAL